MPTFGNENTTSTNENIDNCIAGSFFTCPENCTIDSIVAYINVGGGGGPI